MTQVWSSTVFKLSCSQTLCFINLPPAEEVEKKPTIGQMLETFRFATAEAHEILITTQPDILSWPCKLFESKAHGPSVIVFNLGKQEPAFSRSCPPPPPRLHYSTFWRSVARRVYHEGMEKLKKETRDTCMQQSSTTNRVLENGDAFPK